MTVYHRHCERGEKIQGGEESLDCFAALAMTGARSLLPALREAAGRGRGGEPLRAHIAIELAHASPRVAYTSSALRHPPPPIPPRHALRARREGRRTQVRILAARCVRVMQEFFAPK